MKLPFLLNGSSGSGHYHSDSPFDIDDNDTDRLDDSISDISVYNPDDDFTEYLWMENEEEFDKLEWQRLEEEELMEQCIENMLQDAFENGAVGDDDESERVMAYLWPE